VKRNMKEMHKTHLILILPLALFLFSCASTQWSPKPAAGTPPSPGTAWTPPKPETSKFIMTPPKVAPEIQNKRDWTLIDLIDLALKTSTQTRTSWLQARSAAAGLGSEKSAYYPTVDLNFDLEKVKGSAVGGRFTFDQSTATPAMNINWVLFDFGKREADVEEARMDLIAANWTNNQTIQDVVLLVEQAYYQYLNAKALQQSQQAAVKRAQTNLDAASQRHEAGVATVADELQAKTALAQAQLLLDTTEGQIQILRAQLAVAIGVPSAAPYLEVIEELPANLPIDQTAGQVEKLVLDGIQKRPELEAARAEALSAQAHIRSVRGEGLPTISANANFNRQYFLNDDTFSNNYTTLFSISFPLFTGFKNKYDTLQAKEDAEAARENVRGLAQQVGLQIWTSYYNLNTSAQRIRTAQNLVKSAQESYDVASGRYKEGVGSILDVLTAQTALEDARAQDVQSRTDWLLSLAQLSHATGTLGITGAPATGITPRGGNQ